MYPELYQYLLLHKKLPVPGIGTFSLLRKPAVIDFPNRLAMAPVYSFALQESTGEPPLKLFSWLGAALGMPGYQAEKEFRSFAAEWKRQAATGDVIEWKGVGTISKGLGGGIKFVAAMPLLAENPVPAAKVLREKAAHSVRVGEEEKTSAEMEAILAKPGTKKSFWWAYALAAGLLAVLFIGWYLSEKGVDTAATGNTMKLQPQEATVTCRELR